MMSVVDRCLKELRHYEHKVKISDEQLVIIASKLNIKDSNLRIRILKFIEYQLLIMKVKIRDKQRFLPILKPLLNRRITKSDKFGFGGKAKIINLLALMGLDEELMEQLKTDIKNKNLKAFIHTWQYTCL